MKYLEKIGLNSRKAFNNLKDINHDKIKLVLLKKIGQTILNQEYSIKNLNGFLRKELID